MLESIVTPDAGGTQKSSISDDSKLKGQQIDDAHDVHSQNTNEITDKKFMDEESSIDNLPDALDIGDVPAQASTGEWSSAKVTLVVGESSNSSDFADVAAPS
ncbi:hypothetical protein Ancab_022762 [Ancistrocladus abbreviatus]